MKRATSREAGFTLVEMIFAAALLGLIVLTIGHLVSPTTKFFQRSGARQQANQQLRTCMETIRRVMTNGRAASCSISTPGTVPTVPFSRAQFTGVDNALYTITWSKFPLNSVYLLRQQNGVTNNTLLANNVTNLNFGFDVTDPGIMNVVLEMTVPLDSSGAADSFLTVSLPSQIIRMNAS